MADNLLRLSATWGHSADDGTDLAPLIALDEALEQSSLRRGISRDAFLKELLSDLHHQRLIPLLLMLPRRWRGQSASLPEHLRSLGSLLENNLFSPLLGATLADDLQHILPAVSKPSAINALDRWCQRQISISPEQSLALPQTLEALWSITADAIEKLPVMKKETSGTLAKISAMGGVLTWSNCGLPNVQAEPERRRNSLLAQILNVLGSNRLPRAGTTSELFRFEGVSSGRALLNHLHNKGWQSRARFRSSVATFGLGASTFIGEQWKQIPLGVPYRTGLLDPKGEEMQALMPHCSVEMELQPPGSSPVLLQYYQGAEGLNGWAGLNELHRPWQNERSNGTVAYQATELSGEQLEETLDLCELIGAVHNNEAQFSHLHMGGYGALGFCIDSTALVEQAMTGRTNLFPLALGDLWRQRLHRQLQQQLDAGLQATDDSVNRYRLALDELPQDLFHDNQSRPEAHRRLKASQPRHSPFALVRALNGEFSTED
ncbi:ArgR family transcriptional regulator [Synechococcus sp. UW179A]|uniref:ArgR family transcriptional regulator n=1 Tax=Synechococcus sp. UW179A TaxID=2575510 RepID=UPI000E0EA841|nr:ArgR family transcriptional regulator [Synechococcus sp. UW179A]